MADCWARNEWIHHTTLCWYKLAMSQQLQIGAGRGDRGLCPAFCMLCCQRCRHRKISPLLLTTKWCVEGKLCVCNKMLPDEDETEYIQIYSAGRECNFNICTKLTSLWRLVLCYMMFVISIFLLLKR